MSSTVCFVALKNANAKKEMEKKMRNIWTEIHSLYISSSTVRVLGLAPRQSNTWSNCRVKKRHEKEEKRKKPYRKNRQREMKFRKEGGTDGGDTRGVQCCLSKG